MLLAADNWAERKLRAIKTRGDNPLKPYTFETSCVAAQGADIDKMREGAMEVTYRTMLKYCDLETFAEEMQYEKRADLGLTLKNDLHVAYYKSTYQGQPCYFLVHSHIEYIWCAP